LQKVEVVPLNDDKSAVEDQKATFTYDIQKK